ncbi:MAG: hypothetical protein ACLRFE_03965 [Clostridia bacterium]
MLKNIERSNEIYETEGRSDSFVEVEEKVIDSNKISLLYFFARYSKGADIKRLQQIVLEKGNMEIGYYFVCNVPGAEIHPFIEKAVQTKNTFWVEKFIEKLIEDYRDEFPEQFKDKKVRSQFDANRESEKISESDILKYYGVYELLEGFERQKFATRLGGRTFDINYIVEKANEEYDRKGRSPRFKHLEKCALHSRGSACSRLFVEHVPGSNIKDFERVALLRGEPFNMFVLAGCDGVNKDLMLTGLELAKMDYTEEERSLKIQIERKKQIEKEIEETTDSGRIKKLLKEYNGISKDSDYINKINGDYIPRVTYLARHSNDNKK